MSNWSVLFLVTALIAALFAFGFIDSTVSERAQVVFAIAVVLLAIALVVDRLRQSLPLPYRSSKRETAKKPNGSDLRETTADVDGRGRLDNVAQRGSANNKR